MPTQPPSPGELRRAIDPDTALAHEDPTSPFLEDARHWLSVYGELVALKVALLERADEVLKGASDDAVKEANLDQRLLRAQAERYLDRRRFWADRARALEAGDAPEPAESEHSA